MEVLELQGDCWKTGHWPLGFSAPNAYVIETDSRHTQRAALHVRGPGPGPEVHTLVGTFHHGDSSCVFQRGTTERSLGKEELRSPELFLFFCGHWKCNSTKVSTRWSTVNQPCGLCSEPESCWGRALCWRCPTAVRSTMQKLYFGRKKMPDFQEREQQATVPSQKDY